MYDGDTITGYAFYASLNFSGGFEWLHHTYRPHPSWRTASHDLPTLTAARAGTIEFVIEQDSFDTTWPCSCLAGNQGALIDSPMKVGAISVGGEFPNHTDHPILG